MATYNGEKHISQQIDSILANMSESDELVISDDGSKDKTIEIIEKYRDSRIKIFRGPRQGVKQNFANAIKNSSGKYIFLSDQDDVWANNKITKILEVFTKTHCTCILHNAEIVDENLLPWNETFFTFRKSKTGYFINILKNSYIGCCMAFDAALKNIILPIPDTIEMHDQWIGLLSEKIGENKILDSCLIKYRRHWNNFSEMKHHPIKIMLRNRYNLLVELRKRLVEVTW